MEARERALRADLGAVLALAVAAALVMAGLAVVASGALAHELPVILYLAELKTEACN